MSSPVSPRQRDIGEVASLRAEGVAPTAAKRLFCEVESRKVFNAAMLILIDPLRLRPSPIRALRAAEEDIATYPPSTAHNHIFASITDLSTHNPKLSTLNPQPSTHLRHKKPLHCRSSARQHRGKPHQLLSRNGRLSLPCPKQFIPCMRFGFRKTCKPLSRPSDAFPPDGQFILSLPPNIQTLF